MQSRMLQLALVLLAASPLPATPTIYDNIAVNGGLLYNSADSRPSQLPSTFSFDAGMADDFRLPPSFGNAGDWLVAEVEWNGRFITGAPTSIDGFNIIFWPDVGSAPDGGSDVGSGPKYSSALAIYNNVPAASSPSGGGSSNFSYYASLPVPFLAHADTSYWIEIQAALDYPPLWAPEMTQNASLALPHYGFDLFATPFWTKSLEQHDVAFRLKGEAAPEPAAILMLLPALLLIRRR